MINRNSKRELGRKRGLASAKAWRPSKADADTRMRRSLDDARGQIVREGVCYKAGKEIAWQVRRSVSGRSDQLDLVSNGRPIQTSGRRGLAKEFRP
jgi:hypothetical protein